MARRKGFEEQVAEDERLTKAGKKAADATVKLDPQAAREMVEAVRQIDIGVRDIFKAGLNRQALLVLLADQCRLPKRTISKVLDSLADLRAAYLGDAT